MGENLATGERVEPLGAATNEAYLAGNTAVDWLAVSGLLPGNLPASLSAWQQALGSPDLGAMFGNTGTDCDVASVIHHVLDNFNHSSAAYDSLFAHDGDASSTYQTAMQTYLQSLSTTV
jgi:hypothetical protein